MEVDRNGEDDGEPEASVGSLTSRLASDRDGEEGLGSVEGRNGFRCRHSGAL